MDIQEGLLSKIRKYNRKHLSEHRVKHIEGVADVCHDLAIKYGYDEQKAFMTGLLHDCAKNFTPEQYKAYIDKYGIDVTEREIACGSALLHSKVGAWLLREEFGIDDEEIFSAVYYHTVGRPDMSLLEKILFVADYIEPGRDMDTQPPLDCIRMIAFEDIDEAVRLILMNTINYLKNSGRDYIDPETMRTYDYYKGIVK